MNSGLGLGTAIAGLALIGAGFGGGYATAVIRAPQHAPAPPTPREPQTPPADPEVITAIPTPPSLPEPAPGPREAAALDPRGAPPCDGIAVHGVLVFAEPEWSVAILATPEGAFVRRRGQALGPRRVLHVARDRVWLVAPSSTSTYALCQAELGPAPAAATPAQRVPASPRDPLVGHVEARGPTELAVDRAAFDALVEDPSALMASARIAPDIVQGRIAGMKLAFVRPGSPLERLGLRAGDRLAHINGIDLTSVERAMEAYARFRTAPRLSVGIVRDGREMTLDYEIR